MRILDRREHPVLSAAMPNVVSGVAIAALVGAAGLITRTGLLVRPVPLWVLIVFMVAAASVSALLVGRRSRPADRVFLVVPAFQQKHWVSELMHNTYRFLDRCGYELTLKIPDKDYSGNGQVHHLRRILAAREEYDAGIIVPVDVEAAPIRHDLKDFCEKFAKPVVMMDAHPFEDERAFPANTAFVGYDPAGIGECAAKWVVRELAGEADPVVVVVGCRDHSDRQLRFAEVVEQKLGLSKDQIIVHDNGEFARMRARKVVDRCLRELRGEGRTPSVIFCTNDDMALGAVDALLADGTTTATVVGVDGAAEAKALIDTGQSPLRATVVQDSYRVGEIAMDLLERMRKGERVHVLNSLDPELYTAGS